MAKKKSLIKRPSMANAGAMKRVLDAQKYETVVLGDIQTHLLTRADGPRDKTRLHPSEVCKADWCPRSSFYALADPESVPADDHGYVLLNIFDEGHSIHDKYQSRLWDMGILRGQFGCHSCGRRWQDTSPGHCLCGANRGCLEYREVPLRNDEYFLIGHADGDLDIGDGEDDPLLEVKSVGLGTVRVENPALFYNHTHAVTLPNGKEKTITDLEGLWADIKRPFPSHVRQGMLYLFLMGRERMVFIYESKWHQQTKEFVIQLMPSVVKPILDGALDVKHALDTGHPPARPGWAAKNHTTCEKCPHFSTCYDKETADGDDEPGDQAGGRGRGEEEGGAAGKHHTPDPTPLRHPDGAPEARRVVRRRADASVRGADSVD